MERLGLILGVRQANALLFRVLFANHSNLNRRFQVLYWNFSTFLVLHCDVEYGRGCLLNNISTVVLLIVLLPFADADGPSDLQHSSRERDFTHVGSSGEDTHDHVARRFGFGNTDVHGHHTTGGVLEVLHVAVFQLLDTFEIRTAVEAFL